VWDGAEADVDGLMDIILDPVDVHEDVATRLEASELRGHVRALPPLDRVVIVRRYGLLGAPTKPQDLARDLHVRIETVRNAERRAMRALRQAYVNSTVG